ncbi:MAG: hypothetical protein ACRDZW_06120 [Acidimicrobiales bacterium]
MNVDQLVGFVAVWACSTLVLGRVRWFRRPDKRDQCSDRRAGTALAREAENWLSSLK